MNKADLKYSIKILKNPYHNNSSGKTYRGEIMTSCCSESPVEQRTKYSSVHFEGDIRPHISLNVKDIDKSKAFYTLLMGEEPVKTRDDYAKYESEEPPINLTLNLQDDKFENINNGHFGIEVKDNQEITTVFKRFQSEKYEIDAKEDDVACCFAVQDKIWLVDPDDNHWEIFVVTAHEADDGCGPTCICYDPDSGGCKW